MANLVRVAAKTPERVSTGLLAVSADSRLAKQAGQLVIKLRALYNQPQLEIEQLKVTGVAWAEELIKAGVPPSRWDEMAGLARQWRPSASKAFAITCDQVIDVWQHYGLRGSTWRDGEWVGNYTSKQTKFCGECRKGYRFVSREAMRMNAFGIQESYDPPYFQEHSVGPCRCQSEYRARDSYYFRRFAAAYEIAYGRGYEVAEAELFTLYELTNVNNCPLTWECWDEALREYLVEAKAPTLEDFCACEAFEDIREQRKREEERRRWQAEKDAEDQRKRQEYARERAEAQRKQDEAFRLARERQQEEWNRKWESFKERTGIKEPWEKEQEPEKQGECPF